MAGLIEKILGGRKAKKSATPAEALVEAEAAIQRHAEETAAAKAELVSVASKRKTLLLDDKSDQAIAELEAQRAAVELKLERLDELRAPLAAKLSDARDGVREARFVELKAEFWPAAEDYLEHARGVIAAIDIMNRVRSAAVNANLRAEAASFFPLAGRTLSDEAIREFDRTITRARAIAEGAYTPPPPRPSEMVAVRWLKDPEAHGIKPPRPGWTGMLGNVHPDAVAKLVADGVVELVDRPTEAALRAEEAKAAGAANRAAGEPDDSGLDAVLIAAEHAQHVEPKAKDAAPDQPQAPKATVDRAAWRARTMLLSEREG